MLKSMIRLLMLEIHFTEDLPFLDIWAGQRQTMVEKCLEKTAALELLMPEN